jgi:hypothetical protein
MNGTATAGSVAMRNGCGIEGRDTTMTAAIHAIALSTLFAAHLVFSAELDGVRRALQTMAAGEASVQTVETTIRADRAAA